ncbi:MAG: oligosaccharide repeat unit polymerase [Candidatus Marinimicrobia bacterium]|mgnify:FL=1|nr:oligosaccharide repeat unit polymerase [Candidatus Neomarinimicrobiota bacterium]
MNLDQITSLTFFSIVFALTTFEKRRLNTLVTPFIVTAWPFAIISVLVNYILIYIGFKPFTMRAQLFVLCNLMILWIIGQLFSHFYKTEKTINQNSGRLDNLIMEYSDYEWLVIIISWIVIGVILKKVISLFNQFGGFAFLGDPRFEDKMTHGFAAHMGEVAKVCFILLGIFFRFSKRKVLSFLTLVGLFIALAAMQVKYHLLWVVIMLFIYKINEIPPSKQWKALLWTGIIVLFIMNLFWVLLTIAWKTFSFTSEGVWKFLLEHTMLYITSSPINLDEWLNYPAIKPDSTMLSVFYNIKNVIIGNPLRSDPGQDVSIGFLPISNITFSNTGTAYGVFYLIGGWMFTLFMTVLLSVIYYWVFFQNRRQPNIYLTFINIFCMTLATLTFFVQYLTLLSLYEFIFIYLIMITIFRVLNYLKLENRSWQNNNTNNYFVSEHF